MVNSGDHWLYDGPSGTISPLSPTVTRTAQAKDFSSVFRIPSLRELPPELRLPIVAAITLLAAILAVVLIPHNAAAAHSTASRRAANTTAQRTSTNGGTGLVGTEPTATGSRSPTTTTQATTKTTAATTKTSAATTRLPLAKAVGQLIIATYAGATPPESFLRAVREGKIGAVILMGVNTTGGVAGTRKATNALQRAARAGGNPGLLIMTDQEGGQVKRLPSAPPYYPASGMGNPHLAAQQGLATAKALKAAGINVDLAPVADVSVIDGFMTQEQRTFGSSASVVARAACSFAEALARSGVAYTLKHFPGLGDAQTTTDNAPVSVPESAASIYANDAAYRRCGHGKLALVMISSASYPNLTGAAPAVLSPLLYRKVIKQDHINALLISDSFESGAIESLQTPALKALNAGLDMVMYPGYESVGLSSYAALLSDAERGLLSKKRVDAAASRVLELKRNLGLTKK